MKIHPEDYEEIGHNFTRGLGIGCAFSLPLTAIIIALAIWWLR